MDTPIFTQFKFKVPFTNPVYFGKVHNGTFDRMPWDDSIENEQYRDYTQKWSPSDRLSLQFSWENIANSMDLAITFIVNGAVRKVSEYSVSSATTVGVMYSEFVVQRTNANGYKNGCYCFSQKISEIIDDGGEQMLHAGDTLAIEVIDPTMTKWRSNDMCITEDIAETKVIHYSNSSAKDQTVFDTLFGYMPFGYDIRLECDFTELTPVNSATVFQDYYGGYELVSSVPHSTLKLSIGDNGVRIPRYMLNTINTIFSCDKKSIDGIGFEMTGDSLSVNRIQGYANDVYSIIIAKSANSMCYESTGQNTFTSSYQPDGPAIKKADPKYNTGSITVQTSDEWYIDGDSASSDTLLFDRVSGGAGTTTVKYLAEKNFGDSDVVETVNFVSKDSDSIVGTVEITRRVEPRKGIGYMKIGDTFMIR